MSSSQTLLARPMEDYPRNTRQETSDSNDDALKKMLAPLSRRFQGWAKRFERGYQEVSDPEDPGPSQIQPHPTNPNGDTRVPHGGASRPEGEEEGDSSFALPLNMGQSATSSQGVQFGRTSKKGRRPLGRRSRDWHLKDYATRNPLSVLYLHLLLRLPLLYLSRIDKIFSGGELTVQQIEDMMLQVGVAGSAADRVTQSLDQFPAVRPAMGYPPAYLHLKARWEEFIDTLMEEWKTLNILSALLLGAIMTVFQIQGAAQDPIARYLAFWSLICALMSLLHGCMLIVRFSTMRKPYKAAQWAMESKKDINIFWNVWTMLAMPIVWLTWSVITYIICIMSFMWRSSTAPGDYDFHVSPSTENCLRVFVSAVLAVGAIYTVLIVGTLRRYGSRMDLAWRKRLDEYRERQLPTQLVSPRINNAEPLHQSPSQYSPDTQIPPLRPARLGNGISSRLGSVAVREREIIEEHPDEAEGRQGVVVLPPTGSRWRQEVPV